MMRSALQNHRHRSLWLPLVAASLLLAAAPPLAAQTGTLFVEGDRVGVGTPTPNSSLQIKQNGATLDVEDSNTTDAARILLRLTNRGRINFNLFNTATNENWQFSNSLIGFQINQTVSPNVEFLVTNDGDLFLEGQLFASSSREAKESLREVDALVTLDKVRGLPLSSWSYEGRTNVRHIGPMAEDFHSVFGLGVDASTLSPSDTSGVALAAIQGLGTLLDEKDEEIESLRARLEVEESRVQDLSERLAALERALQDLTEEQR